MQILMKHFVRDFFITEIISIRVNCFDLRDVAKQTVEFPKFLKFFESMR